MSCEFYKWRVVVPFYDHLSLINHHLEEMGVPLQVDERDPRNKNVSLSCEAIELYQVHILGVTTEVVMSDCYYMIYEPMFGGRPGILKDAGKLIAFNGSDFLIIETGRIAFKDRSYIDNLPIWTHG